MERISSYIHENYDHKISLEMIASHEGLSRTYFSHFFKSNFGINFNEYLNKIRSEKARTLLSSSKDNLLNIAYMCGFSDIRTLNTAFVKSYGVLPKDFRKNNFEKQLILAQCFHLLMIPLSKEFILLICSFFRGNVVILPYPK